MTDTSQTLPMALIACDEPGAVDSCKSLYSHWVEPQIVDFYTADLYVILLSAHNDSFSRYNTKKIVTDYSLKLRMSFDNFADPFTFPSALSSVVVGIVTVTMLAF